MPPSPKSGHHIWMPQEKKEIALSLTHTKESKKKTFVAREKMRRNALKS